MITIVKLYAIVAFSWGVHWNSHIESRVILGGLTDRAECERLAGDLQGRYFSQVVRCVEVAE